MDEYPPGFEFAQDNYACRTRPTISSRHLSRCAQSGDVWLAFLFNFDFGNKGSGPTDDPVPYSIIDIQGIPRPAFGALADMPKDQ
jgi:hypothetical protein